MRLPRRINHGESADLVDHLGELRGRLVVSLIAVVGGTAVGYAFHHQLIHWLNAPLPNGRQPITLGVAEPFTTSLKVSIYAGFALALPVILWQVWSFLAPALDRKTERALGRFVVFATVLFAVGVTFSYKVALPAAVKFLTQYDSSVYDIQVRASSYYSFVLMVLLSVGLVFELPIFILALVRLGVTSSARLRGSRKIGYVAMAALAVALPGVDPVTTAMEMAPLMLLYEGSIWLSVAFERRWNLELGADVVPSKP
jgi:sec-independent protein translocase protein TatC